VLIFVIRFSIRCALGWLGLASVSPRGLAILPRMACHHPNTSAEDGALSARLVCDDCGAVLIEPTGWWPTDPPRVAWIRREIPGTKDSQ